MKNLLTKMIMVKKKKKINPIKKITRRMIKIRKTLKKINPPKPKQGQLSPEQVKSLLEAMNNQEKKVQDKINAKKVKGKPVKTKKDW